MNGFMQIEALRKGIENIMNVPFTTVSMEWPNCPHSSSKLLGSPANYSTNSQPDCGALNHSNSFIKL